MSRPVPLAYVLGLWAAFILGTISFLPALCQSKLGQGLNRFLDRAASTTWTNRVCWSRLFVVNCIAIMMASLDFRARFSLHSQCSFLKCPVVTRTVFLLSFNPSNQFSSFSISPVLQTSFSVASDFLLSQTFRIIA